MNTNLVDVVHNVGTSVVDNAQRIVSNVQTNKTINDAVVAILTGAKDAGSEIYSASKTAITSAVDFTMEQAPLVVREFLHWKLAEAILWSIIAIVIFTVVYIVFKRIRNFALNLMQGSEDRDIILTVAWFTRIVATVALMIMLSVQAMHIVKITVAPRVYLIEYVVHAVQDVRGKN